MRFRGTSAVVRSVPILKQFSFVIFLSETIEKRRETTEKRLAARSAATKMCKNTNKYSANIDVRTESTAISGDGVVNFTQYRRIS